MNAVVIGAIFIVLVIAFGIGYKICSLSQEDKEDCGVGK